MAIIQLMRQTYPGQMPAARLNLFNVVLVLDFSQPGSLYYIASTISNIIQRGNPIRFGVVPMVTEGERREEGERMARLIWYLVDRYGRAKTMGFLKNVSFSIETRISFGYRKVAMLRTMLTGRIMWRWRRADPPTPKTCKGPPHEHRLVTRPF